MPKPDVIHVVKASDPIWATDGRSVGVAVVVYDENDKATVLDFAPDVAEFLFKGTKEGS